MNNPLQLSMPLAPPDSRAGGRGGSAVAGGSHRWPKSSEVPLPTIDRLRAVLRIEDGALVWNRSCHGIRNGSVAGTWGKPRGYATVMIDRKACLVHRVVFALMHGRWPVGEIDHINGNSLDNRPENLREATHAQNNQNRGLTRSNKSGAKGVCFKAGAWEAAITVNDRYHYLGRFTDIEAAGQAYADAATRLHGEFANVPEFREQEQAA